jgi:ATP-dependent exoDNAse (exonuclease V) beta subunit
VIDYKTDRVDGDELARRAASYGSQGRAYTTALARALELPAPPRFELWFLRAGRVVTLP